MELTLALTAFISFFLFVVIALYWQARTGWEAQRRLAELQQTLLNYGILPRMTHTAASGEQETMPPEPGGRKRGILVPLEEFPKTGWDEVEQMGQ